jgi:circadian clock protein KaiC
LEKVLAVVKMRGSSHSTDFRVYDLTSAGAVIGKGLTDYHGVTTGVPTRDEQCSALGSDVIDDE